MSDETTPMQAPPTTNGAKAEVKPAKKQILLDVKLSTDRLKKYVTLDEYIALEEGSSRSAKALVASSLWDATNNQYIDYEAALDLVGKMTLEQSQLLFERLKADLSEEAVPKEYGIVSESD